MVYIGHAEVQTRGTGGRGCGVHLQGGTRAGGGQVPTLVTVPGSCRSLGFHGKQLTVFLTPVAEKCATVEEVPAIAVYRLVARSSVGVIDGAEPLTTTLVLGAVRANCRARCCCGH